MDILINDTDFLDVSAKFVLYQARKRRLLAKIEQIQLELGSTTGHFMTRDDKIGQTEDDLRKNTAKLAEVDEVLERLKTIVNKFLEKHWQTLKGF